MTSDDLQRIEAALSVRLPEAYRSVVLAYPVPACAGNADTELWDDPGALIAFNLELRSGASGGVKPWPTNMFALGHAGDGSPTAIDLNSADAAVWWADRCHLDGVGSGKTHDTFSSWVTGYVADLKSDCEGDGIDPNGPPQARDAAHEESARADGWCMLYLIGGALLVIAALLLIRWLARQ